MPAPFDVSPDAAAYLLAELRLRGVDAPSVDAAINEGHLTEMDWVNALDLFRAWEEGKRTAARKARVRTWKGRMSDLAEYRLRKLHPNS